MTKFVLIVECREKFDPGSEGRFVMHMLNLMGIRNLYCSAKSPSDFSDIVSKHSPHANVIQITTHGEYKEIKGQGEQFTGFATPGNAVTIASIKASRINLNGKTVLSTACFSGQKAAGKAFKNATKCEHYIAPKGAPRFYNAALMCHIFYHKHFIKKRNVIEAFSEYADRYKNPHKFCIL